MVQLEDIEIRILRYLHDDGPNLKSLFEEEKIPPASGYRKAKKLEKKGYIEKDGNGYTITEMGRSVIKNESPSFNWNILERHIPHLKYIPLPIHRIIIELILVAIIARRDEIRKDHHPTIVLFGPTATFKTWSVKIVCSILGLPYETHIIPMMGESGKSVFIRKDARGNVVTKRNFMDFLLVCFDELHKASRQVKDLCLAYLQGEMIIAIDNDTMKLCPVPIITYNPKPGESTGERIDYEPQNLRRSVLCDFQNVDIPHEVKSQGTPLLDKLEGMKSITLPKYKTKCEEYRERVFNFLEGCKEEDSELVIDTEMVLLICAGMTAFLPENQAVVLGVERYLSIMNTTGYLKEGWRDDFDIWHRRILMSADVNEEIDPDKDFPTDDGHSDDLAYEIPLEFDYARKMRMIKENLEYAKVNFEDFEDYLKKYSLLVNKGMDIDKIVSLMDSIDLEDVEEVIRDIKGFKNLQDLIDDKDTVLQEKGERIRKMEEHLQKLKALILKMGSTPERIHILMQIQTQLDGCDIDIDDVDYYLSNLKELDDMGLNLEQVRSLIEEIERQGKDDDTILNMISCIDRFEGLENALEAKREEIQKSKDYHELIEKGIREEEAQLKEIEGKKEALEQECQDLDEMAERASSKLTSVQKRISQADREVKEILSIKDDATDIIKALTDLKQDKEQLEAEVKNLTSERDDIQKDLEDLNEDRERVLGWCEFLFNGQIPGYRSVIDDMDMAVKISRGEKPLLKEYEKMYSDKVRKGLIEPFLEMYKSDYVSKWRYEYDLKNALDIIEAYKEENEHLKEMGQKDQ